MKLSNSVRMITAISSLMLGLVACKPKPTHEIGKVEYDKLADWRELAKLGPQGVRKYLGQTLTFTDLESHGKRQKDESRQNVCKQDFSAFKWAFDWDKPEKDVNGLGIGVYINFGPEVVAWLPAAANDTFLTDPAMLTVPNPLHVEEDICGKCKGETWYNHETHEYAGGQPVEECFLESRALYITGRVIGIQWDKLYDMNDPRTSKNMDLLLLPTGMAW